MKNFDSIKVPSVAEMSLTGFSKLLTLLDGLSFVSNHGGEFSDSDVAEPLVDYVESKAADRNANHMLKIGMKFKSDDHEPNAVIESDEEIESDFMVEDREPTEYELLCMKDAE